MFCLHVAARFPKAPFALDKSLKRQARRQKLVVQNPRSLRGGLVGINTSIIKVFSNVFYIRQGAHSVNAALIVLTTIKQTTIRAT